MNRIKVTSPIIADLCGHDIGLLRATHHGLNETPLEVFYPSLDLKEAVAFAAGSFIGRENEDPMLEWKASNETYHELFSYVFKSGMPWVNSRMSIEPIRKPQFMKLNPFGGRGLMERLQKFEDDTDAHKLARCLIKGVNQYISEAQRDYFAAHQQLSGDEVVMTFLPYSLKKSDKESIAERYSKEIVKMINTYPREIAASR